MSIIRRTILALVLIAGITPAIAQAPPPVPALPDAERRTSYSLSGSTCACAVGFQLYGDSTDVTNWLTVWVNGVQVPQTNSWTISSPTGQIGIIPRPITDAVLTFTAVQTGTVQIVGARRPRRTSQFSENRGVAARDMNQVLTDMEAQLRELWDRQTRTMQAAPSETLAILPALAGRASMNACFDSNGNLTSCVASSSGSFAAGTGVTFTGTNPTTISTDTFTAGAGINISGTSPKVIASTGRIALTGATTFYVDVANGTDVSGCGAAPIAAACRTIQYVTNFLQGSYDLRGFQALIQLANSTSPAYAPVAITGQWTGGDNVIIQGNTGLPGNVLIDGGGGNYCVHALQGAIITVQGVKVQNCALMLASIVGASQIYFQQIDFGVPAASGVSIYCSRQSYCEVIGGGNLISGIGSNFIQTSHQGNFRAAAVAATPFKLTANLILSVGGKFAYTTAAGDLTFTGYTASAFDLNGFTVTGARWASDSGGLIQALNASTGLSLTPTFFPGSVAGGCIGDCLVDQGGHANPSIAGGSCGASPGVAGSDLYGFVNEGTSAIGCVVTFASPFSTPPFCQISWFSGAPPNPSYVVSTTGITLTHDSADSRKFYYECKGS